MAETDPTRIDDPPKASSDWLLIVKDVFPQWRDRLESSWDAADEVYYLLRDSETVSAKCRVDASGKEIPDTNRHVDHPGFWQDRLLLVPDADGGDDHLEVDYGDAYLDFYSPGGHWKFYVRRLDVERWERLYPELAAPPPPPPPAPPPSAPQTTAGAEARAIAPLWKDMVDDRQPIRRGLCRMNVSLSHGSTMVWVRAGLGVTAPGRSD